MCIVTHMTSPAVRAKHKGSSISYASYASFAAFGVFWGTWGASIPRIRDQSGLTDGELGTALLFIGAGALPAMLLTGRLLDRFGIRVTTAASLSLQGAAGLCVALTATGMTSLSLGLLLVGAASGAADVAINAGAGSAERVMARPVITRSHGTFSAFVVVSSLLTGVLNSLGMTPAVGFSLAAASMFLAAGYLLFALPPQPGNSRDVQTSKPERMEVAKAASARNSAFPLLPVVLAGLLAALALAGENAHQSWAAVFFEDVLDTGSDLSSTAPAMFAAVAAVTRFSTGRLNPAHATRTVILGATAATVGTGLLAGATNLAAALAGLAVAAAGTAVLYPTLLGIVSRASSAAAQGRATSWLAAVSYLGFLLGPVYVGLWSEAAGLRGAMIAVAALGALLLTLAPVLLRRSTTGSPGKG
jgi:MFS family permease